MASRKQSRALSFKFCQYAYLSHWWGKGKTKVVVIGATARQGEMGEINGLRW
ncbi:hypothetical protein Q427_03485 [Halomonas sp. BC04]|nr:hypothetical protein Q427_03485 [Halomonas sp. BC04]